MNWEKGIIGALGGAATGYAAGKVAGIDSMQKMNTTLLSHVLDQKIAEFKHGLDVKMEDVKLGNTLARDEKYIEGLIGRDKTNAELDLEKAKLERGWEQEDSGTEFERQKELARFKAGLGGRGGSSQGEYAINPETGEQVFVPKGSSPPEGFTLKTFWEKDGKGATGSTDVAKQNFMGKYGVSEDPMGGFVSDPMTSEQKAQAEAEARQMGLNVYFKKGTDDGGWFGKSKDVYTISSIAPAMGGQGIIGGQAPQGQAIGAGQQRSQNDPLGEQIAKIKKQASSVQGKPKPETEQPGDGGQKKTYERGSYTEAPTTGQRQEAMQEWAALGSKTKDFLDDVAKEAGLQGGFLLETFLNKPLRELAGMSKDAIMRLVEWQKQAQQENPLPATRR